MGGSEQPSTDSSYVPGRTALRWIGIGTSILGAGALAAFVTFWTVIDAEYLQRRLNHALANTPVEHYRVEVESVEWGLLDRSLQLRGISVSPGLPTTVQPQIWNPALPRRVQASVSTVRLKGIHLWSLVRHRLLILDAVRLHGLQVRVEGAEGRATAPHDSWVAPSGGMALSLGPLRNVMIHRFRLDGGTFVANRGEGQPRDSLWDVSLRLDSLSTDALADRPPAQVLAAQFSQGAVGGYRRIFPERPYSLRIGSSRVSKPDSILTVEQIRFTPTVSDSVFMRRHEHRVNRIRTVARRISVEGFRVDRFVRDSTFHADRARIESMHLSVYRDNHLPPKPRDPPPPMPHEVARAFENVFRIDTIRIRDSAIRYVKRAEKAQHAGAISFENLWATLYNVTNSPRRMTPSHPAVAVLRTDVNGAGRLRATLRVPLRARRLSLSFEGRLGAMDATALNETFVHLGGVRIERGQVDSLWFQADVEQGSASGSLRSVYRNLEIETLEKATGERGLKNRLKTFVVNGLALRSNNLPNDEPFHVGQIRHRHEEGNTFFKFLWLSLRSGIYSMVGIDRLPR